MFSLSFQFGNQRFSNLIKPVAVTSSIFFLSPFFLLKQFAQEGFLFCHWKFVKNSPAIVCGIEAWVGGERGTLTLGVGGEIFEKALKGK